MSILEDLYQGLHAYLPGVIAALLVLAVLFTAHRLLLGRHPNLGAEARLPRQLALLGLSLAGLLLVLLLFPMSDTTRGQVLSLFGIVLTGVIALSSTTFVANVMAGLMLRVIHSFSPGDFLRVGEQFGRVTERGLMHTEIQTEERDLTTLPNLYLVTHPVTVVHGSGTIIAATVSLGYDVARTQVEDLLKQAAAEVGLEEPFVRVEELGDYAVVYRVAGFLPEVKQLLTRRSNLRKAMMDVLHGAGIEIVSPSFMNQRQLPENRRFIPPQPVVETPPETTEAPEEIIFDKAEEAEQKEHARQELAEVEKEIDELKAEEKTVGEALRPGLERRLSDAERRRETLLRQLGEDDAEA